MFNTVKFIYVSQFHLINFIKFLKIFIISLLLSMGGLPPLAGFFAKLVIFFFLLQTNFLTIFLFFSFNLVALFFYLQHIKFITQKKNLVLFKLFLGKFKINYQIIYSFLFTLLFIYAGFFF
jgi:NADH-quinone oxidoreductase subunit N